MARRPQPLQIRRLHGNPSRRPMPPEPEELKPRQPLGPPPDFLGVEASAVWKRVSDSMPVGIVANCDLDLMAGGVHYDLSRVAPNVYAGGYWVKIRADLSIRPKRLTVSNDDGSCNWAATAA